jgi:acyl transferase domain-containing protein/NAD(P)H-dependent flavin oxidoreductase YrpB (nitropropane dioxygenase family)/NAD(P)-dependent dehydrogenase (short-subunit alcohol dehydrogenase family)
MALSEFKVVVITPGQLSHAGIAVAAARAGAVSILDAVYLRDAEKDAFSTNLKQLLDLTRDHQEIGLRLHLRQIGLLPSLLPLLQTRPYTLLLCGADSTPLPAEALALRHRHPGVRLWVEITDAQVAMALEQSGAPLDGLVVTGDECGGYVGANSTYILAQKLLAKLSYPIYMRGAIGLHTAAACRVGGAAGVVLDDHLLLMPETPLSLKETLLLNKLASHDTTLLGDRLGERCRILLRPEYPASKPLMELSLEMELEDATDADVRVRWQKALHHHIGWGNSPEAVWPLGQMIALSAKLRDTYGTVGRCVQAFLVESNALIQQARVLQPLAPESALALAHKTQYPIVQGPMTRVSDNSDFACAVAEAGALPMLALALMRREQIIPLLQETQRRMQGRSWGIGILGFVPPALREEQIQAVLACKPPFALIAGGRPDLAGALEKEGIATYLHVPTPALLKMFLSQGARRFIFEGRECGGHVGPLSSFALWQMVIDLLLDETPRGEEAQIHLLFAGGIHDALSTTMLAVLTAPLVKRGMRVGALIGTAYIFTQEAVSTGAILASYQEEALACERTINLESGAGHANRCAVTDFSTEFYASRRQLLIAGKSAPEVREALEALCLGRLRAATKGVARTQEGELQPVAPDQRRTQGMYMLGDVASICEATYSIRQLHEAVSEASALQLANYPAEQESAPPSVPASEIAIVGISTLLPGANDPETFWTNILQKNNVIQEVPPERWDWRLFYDPDRKALDKSYSRWGGFLEDIPFDPLKFGIPPNSLRSISTTQLLALEGVRRALEDAGCADGNFDRENTCVILANSDFGGLLGHLYITRTMLPLIQGQTDSQAWQRMPEWTEESFPGMLNNIVAGRVANRFNLGGPNFAVDSACASSLTALDLGVKELESRRSSVAIVGGIDTGQDPFAYIAFSKTQALSPSGQVRTFDKTADGIVISEGVVVMVLKRLEDAEHDGDRVYAVIRSVAGSSDGKALGMTAPHSEGQMRAFDRAYQHAGFSPSTLGLYEAHGTGTAVGDRAEVESIVKTMQFKKAEAKTCAIGSVKTLIGHTKTAAGLVGLAKASLALYHRVLPGHAGVHDPLEAIADRESPLYLLQEAKPWVTAGETFRRAGVSAFGFGGTNAHAVLQEYRGNLRPAPLGASRWPCELIPLRGESREDLRKEILQLCALLDAKDTLRLRDIAYTYACRWQASSPSACSAFLIVDDIPQLREGLAKANRRLQGDESEPLPNYLVLRTEEADPPGRVAFLFPGQGAQHSNMARELALYFQEFRETLEQANRLLAARYERPLSAYLYPPSPYSEEEKRMCEAALRDTHLAQPGIGVISSCFLRLADRLGLRPDMVGGHSYGEFVALYAAGVYSWEALLTISERRGDLMAASCDDPETSGAMVAVLAPREEIEKYLEAGGDVVVANHNAPAQTILSGPSPALQAVIERLNKLGMRTISLPVAGAFHSPLMASVEKPLASTLDAIAFSLPNLPVYGNATGQPYPNDPAAIRRQIGAHILQPVEFVQQIREMYADGARHFIEVGPGSTLTSMVKSILKGLPHTSLSLDAGSGMRGFLTAIARLASANTAVDLTALQNGRDTRFISSMATEVKAKVSTQSQWLLNGSTIRPQTDLTGSPGKAALRTSETEPTITVIPPVPPERPVVRHQEAQEARPPMMDNTHRQPKAVVNDSAGNHSMGSDLLTAYQMYQETMRQFLKTQEVVMQQFLNGANVSAPPDTGISSAQKPDVANTPLRMEPSLLTFEEPGALSRVLSNGVAPLHTSCENAAVVAHGVSNGTAPIRSAPSVPLPSKEQDEKFEYHSLVHLLVNQVSEYTGYPTEMLGTELDIEAELGIDSIKRIEIIDGFRQALPDVFSTRIHSNMDTISRAKSLRQLVEAILREEPALPAVAATAVQFLSGGKGAEETGVESGLVDHQAENDSCPRYRMVAQPQPLTSTERTCPTGLVLITEDTRAIAPLIAAKLNRQGATAMILSRQICMEPEALTRTVAALRLQHGAVQGVLHLAALDDAPLPDRLEEWKICTQIHVKSLFLLLQACAQDLHPLPHDSCGKRLLTASLFGGHFGRDGRGMSGLASGGGGQALLRTIQAEYKECRPVAIDIDGEVDADSLANLIIAEYLSSSTHIEVGYSGGERLVFAVESAPLVSLRKSERVAPEAHWVVLVTGGARGITAEVVRTISRPGLRLVILGLTPEPEPEPEALAALTTTGALREYLTQIHRTAVPPRSPAYIEEQVQAILRRRSIRENLATLRSLGVQVEYHAIDVANEGAFVPLIEAVYQRYGRIDMVIHGAGIIHDKLLEDKAFTTFEEVFDTKADSTFLLLRHLRQESLKCVLLFSSTAGRFGNRGQSDYAAANEVLNRLAWKMREIWPLTRVVAINWGPWATTGMASSAVNRNFKAGGILPISAPAGCSFVMEELYHGTLEDVEIIAGQGPWHLQANWSHSPVAATEPRAPVTDR